MVLSFITYRQALKRRTSANVVGNNIRIQLMNANLLYRVKCPFKIFFTYKILKSCLTQFNFVLFKRTSGDPKN
jgi:hypothetical protein